MTTLDHALSRAHEACQPGTGRAVQHADHAQNLLRHALKRELEAEIRGLLMAARAHGFHIAIKAGKPVVTDAPS